MLGLILSTLLLMAPLPGLPSMPSGAEVRVVSPDLRTVYFLWRVNGNTLQLQARPLTIPPGSRVRLLIRSGRQLHAYEGRYLEGDIFIEASGGYISVKQAFAKVYRLRWSPSDPFFNNAAKGQNQKARPPK